MREYTFSMAILACALVVTTAGHGQDRGLVNTSKSSHARLVPLNLTDVQWTDGFWAERFAVCKEAMVPHVLNHYMDDEVSHAFANFEIAAGMKEGRHRGAPFHDGDFYKILEGAIAVHAAHWNDAVDQEIDAVISVIGQSQRKDGYIHTPVVIKQREHMDLDREFEDRLDFETYNMGHLMTAACLHHRITGKRNFLAIAIRATDFLFNYCQKKPAELAQNAICPSHYMGVVEMYRTTGDPRYLELAKALIDIRSMVKDGTDHNQDRIPLRRQTEAVGHAVRANYLYAGAADVYLETGDHSLMTALDAIWLNLIQRKLYITGGCGALYDGVSPRGTSYKPSEIQQIHQAYGMDYELPNRDAHNESCANIGNILWNWRMLLATADAKYADIIERVLYNSLLAGVSLDGKGYFYTNPLAVSQDLPYTLRWSKEREPYIRKCNCCPPNTIRTIAEVHNYVYSLSENGLWIHLYGSNMLTTRLPGGDLELRQVTEYPWRGEIQIVIDMAPEGELPIHLRIPGWCEEAEILVNSTPFRNQIQPGTYATLEREWKQGDVVHLNLAMETDLIQTHPLVEDNRNQVAVRRGPVVYCLESMDIPKETRVFDIVIPASIEFHPETARMGDSTLHVLKGTALAVAEEKWQGELYRKVNRAETTEVAVQLVPYYAWGNRGKGEMAVWLSFER
jgi:DUF1680 family protein